MNKIDNWIELQFTRLLHWVQRITGFTSFRVSHQLALLIVVDGLCQIFDYWFQGIYKAETDSTLVFIVGFSILVWTIVALICDHIDRKFHENPKAVPFLFITPAIFRLLMLVLTIFSVSPSVVFYLAGEAGYLEFCTIIGSVSLWAFYYTASIPPLPPSESKVRSWLKSFRSSPVLRPAESTV